MLNMGYRPVCVAGDPLDYFLQKHDKEHRLRIADVVIRENKSAKELFSRLIRLATASPWSHSALVYLLNDPHQGYDNTFLIEVTTKGAHVASWRKEIYPFKEFTVGIKRLNVDWYAETPYEKSRHDPHDPEDTHGISYLRHVRGIALDHINSLYDHKTVYEMTALYAERLAKRHFGSIPSVADAAAAIADLFRKWDEDSDTATNMLHFICSGMVQYSFFEALRRRIINDLAIPEHQDAAISNLHNMHRILFRDDTEGVFADYIQDVQSGKLDIAAPVPGNVLDLLKTATPADFSNSASLEWRYVIRQGIVWRIDKIAGEYEPHDDEEAAVLEMMRPEQ
jgi:hypothetical protein